MKKEKNLKSKPIPFSEFKPKKKYHKNFSSKPYYGEDSYSYLAHGPISPTPSRDQWINQQFVKPVVQPYYPFPLSYNSHSMNHRKRMSSQHNSDFLVLSPYKKTILLFLYFFFPLIPLADLYLEDRRWIIFKVFLFDLFCVLTYFLASNFEISIPQFFLQSLNYIIQAGIYPFNATIFQKIFQISLSPSIQFLYLGFMGSFILNFFIHYTGLIGTLTGIKKDGKGRLIYYL